MDKPENLAATVAVQDMDKAARDARIISAHVLVEKIDRQCTAIRRALKHGTNDQASAEAEYLLTEAEALHGLLSSPSVSPAGSAPASPRAA